MTIKVEYTSEKTWEDYDKARIETLRLMMDARETTSMEQIGNTVIYKKYVDDFAPVHNSNAHWYERYQRRTETVIIKETGEVLCRKTYEDIEYYGSATKGKSFFVHRVITRTF